MFFESNDILLTIAEYARLIHATDLFLGYSITSAFFPVRKPAAVQLSEYLPNVDIHIIPDTRASEYPALHVQENSFTWKIRDIILVIVIMTIATMLSAWFDQSRFSNANCGAGHIPCDLASHLWHYCGGALYFAVQLSVH